MSYWKQEGERRMAASAGFTERVIESSSRPSPSRFQERIQLSGTVPELNRSYSTEAFLAWIRSERDKNSQSE